MDQPAEDLAAPYPRRSQVGNRVGDDATAVWWPQIPGPVRATLVVVRDVLVQDRAQVPRPGLRSSRAKAASTARSAQSSLGLGCWRRSNATSWRSTSSSASFDADERASSAIHPARRTNIR